MTKRKLIYLCGFILGFFIIYFVNLLIGNSILINILTPIGSICAFGSLFYAALKSKNYKINYAFLSVGYFVWIIGDILMAYGEIILKIPPEAHVLYNIIIVDMYIIIDIIIAINLVIFYISRKNQMYSFQLIWDNMAIVLCSLGFLWIIFLKDHYNKILALNFDIIASFLCICINIFILTILFSIYLSSKNCVITIKYKFIMFGIAVNSLTDLIQALLVQYAINKITNTAYMISVLCIAIGGILEVYEPLNAKKKVSSEIYSNVGNVRLGLSLFIVPIFIIIIKGFNLYELLYFSIVIFIYNIMSKYIQNSAKIQYLLDKEKKITEKYKLLAKAIEQSPVAISITDENGNIEFINPRFSQLTGYSEEEVLGKTIGIAGSNKFDTKVLKELWDTIQSGRTWKGEYVDKKKNGEEYFGEIIAEPIKNSQDIITNYIFINEDISELKEKEKTLNKAVIIAQEATEAKSMFLANMSHEIRTPMNAIIGMAYLALKTDLTDKQRDYILKIHNAGTSLLGIINDILDFSKIESGKLNLENTNFNLEEVMSNVSI